VNRPVKVLLVEDSQIAAAVLIRMLESDAKISVNTKGTVQDALTEMATNQYDAILLDLLLPDASGVESVQSLHSQRPDIPIIVVTGCEEQGLHGAVVQAGAKDLLKKPVTSELLRHVLRAAVIRSEVEKRVAPIEAGLESTSKAIEEFDRQKQTDSGGFPVISSRLAPKKLEEP
jgi:DNA-binding response OmpR family regulator